MANGGHPGARGPPHLALAGLVSEKQQGFGSSRATGGEIHILQILCINGFIEAHFKYYMTYVLLLFNEW